MARVYAVLRATPTIARLPYAAAVLWITVSGVSLATLGLWGVLIAGPSYPVLVSVLTRDRFTLDVLVARLRAMPLFDRQEGALWVRRD